MSGNIFLYYYLICSYFTSSLKMIARLSFDGIEGEIYFWQNRTEDMTNVAIEIEVDNSTDNSTLEEYEWNIYPLSVDYTQENPCQEKYLGARPYISITEKLGPILLPAKKQMETNILTLWGSHSIYRRSIVIKGRKLSCATIEVEYETELMATATFHSGISGTVFFRTIALKDRCVSKITSILGVLRTISNHGMRLEDELYSWKIFVTDVLENDKTRDVNCKFLQILYDPDNRNDEFCSKESQDKCKIGDLTGKHGLIRIAESRSGFAFTDTTFSVDLLNKSRSFYLLFRNEKYASNVLSCARIRLNHEKSVAARIQGKGIKGYINISQSSPFDPSTLQIQLQNLNGLVDKLQIQVLPSFYWLSKCGDNFELFNPFRVGAFSFLSGLAGTHDRYPVGDLSGKHGTLRNASSAVGTKFDCRLTLFGRNSVVGRAVVLFSSSDGLPLLSANLNERRGMIMAEAVFRYPIVGRILFQQPEDDFESETVVFIEHLLYSDGSFNLTADHRYAIHDGIPGEDYHNWTGRCLSAGNVYNPFKSDAQCYADDADFLCALGNLDMKTERLIISGKKKNIKNSTKIFNVKNLPLSGPYSIIGKSVVIYDDFGPKLRGDRLSCTRVTRKHRHKAETVKFLKNDKTDSKSIQAHVEFYQDTPLSFVKIIVDFKKLNRLAVNYGVHMLSTPLNVEFPCDETAVGENYNPYNVTVQIEPMEGSHDQYAMGDISGKFGNLSMKHELQATFFDTNLMLFGLHSIVGRSLVLYNQNNSRWFCSTLGWGFSPKEAIEYAAIASFHHPNGFLYGYIKFNQVVYFNNGNSDTTIEVNLRHSSDNNKNMTSGHKWAIYVNPVGQDSTVKFYAARCVAAGYRWNPSFINLLDQSNNELYEEECSKETPLRCDVGDLSGKLGALTIGSKRVLFNDVNLPLYGDYRTSIIGKSVVIMEQDGRNERMACANIAVNKHFAKWVTIQKPPKFDPAQFEKSIRDAMGIPFWMFHIDRQTLNKIDGDQCLQIHIYFIGPIAEKLEQDFNTLMINRKLTKASLFIPSLPSKNRKERTIPYKLCYSKNATSSINPLWFLNTYIIMIYNIIIHIYFKMNNSVKTT